MKTIFDKIDTRYLDCANGMCEHVEHKMNAIWWLLPIVALTYIGIKYIYETRRN
jgi:hypothetical protein